jgi:hypothetical protein
MKNDSRKEFYEETIAQSQCNDMNLGQLGLTDDDWSIIIKKAIQERRCASLFLNNNEITSIVELAAELSENTTLKTISLTGNPIKDDVDQLISKDNTTLISLWLNETKISDYEVRKLCAVVQTNSTLEGLYIHSNHLITDKCIYFVIQIMKENQKLKHLWLHNCALSEKAKND